MGYSVQALASDSFHDVLFVGGSFDSASNVAALNLAMWNGLEWKQLPVSPYNAIYAMTMKHDTLIYFASVSNDSQVGMYVDTNFVGFIPALGGPVYCAFVFHDTLYAGGVFDGGIKFWNGTQWQILGGGLSGDDFEMYAMTSYGNELIVGGHFSQAGNTDVNNIAAWYGGQWHALGGGLTYPNNFPDVFSLQEYQGYLFAGGNFFYAGSNFTGGVAKWNGTSWDSVVTFEGLGSCGSPYAMLTVDSVLYVTGVISGDGTFCMGERVAEFDGTNWYDMHMSTGGAGYTIQMYRGQLIVGSDILSYPLGYDSIKYVARFLGFPTSVQSQQTEKSFSISPNPATTTIQIHLSSNQQTTLAIFNLLGEIMREEKISGGESRIDVSDLPSGIYFMKTEKEMIGKFAKQ